MKTSMNMKCRSRRKEAHFAFRQIRASSRRLLGASKAAFSLIEILIAIFIFMLILTAVYSIWHGIVRGTQAGIKAVQEVQRSRVAMHTLEQALLCARVFQDNIKYYYFIADSMGSHGGELSMTCRLPADFLGMGFLDPNLRLRRVDFFTRPSPEGGDELVMAHSPILIETNSPDTAPYSIVLAKDVSRFEIELMDPKKNEWVSTWDNTNSLPTLVRVTLGLGKLSHNSSTPQDLASRIIHLPAQNISSFQGGRPMQPGLQGLPPPGLQNQPGTYSNPNDPRFRGGAQGGFRP